MLPSWSSWRTNSPASMRVTKPHPFSWQRGNSFAPVDDDPHPRCGTNDRAFSAHLPRSVSLEPPEYQHTLGRLVDFVLLLKLPYMTVGESAPHRNRCVDTPKSVGERQEVTTTVRESLAFHDHRGHLVSRTIQKSRVCSWMQKRLADCLVNPRIWNVGRSTGYTR